MWKQKPRSYMCVTSVPLILVLVVLVLLQFLALMVVAKVENFTRSEFPADFVFGSGSSAYQVVEGAAREDGRTPSIWDIFVRANKGVSKGASGDIACDQYHKYKEDVQHMVDTGLEAYRFSVSWSRLIPNGRGHVNPKGLEYYNNLINELLKRGIQPHVTLLHLDTPQVLEDEYGGWLSRKIVKDFTAYADVCFKEFGDRVLYWTTINEGNIFAIGGYDNGLAPPGRCSFPFGQMCTEGDSVTEPYIAGHNMLLAHSSAVKLYYKKYKAVQHGFVGLNIYSSWFSPYSNATEDVTATQRVIDFYIGWFMHPMVFGDYPDIVKKNAGSKIPVLTPLEPEDAPQNQNDDPSSSLSGILEYLKTAYGNPPTYIHENGQRTERNGTLYDISRVKYLHSYIGTLLEAIKNGSNTKGYFQWSFLDGLELFGGYETGSGLYYVDLDDKQLRRYRKLSADWYYNFLEGRTIRPDEITEVETGVFGSSTSKASE
ncbi:beta-glucosidase 11-like isoform X4 [Coffea eugenioides]|nr:beta-glucosidase 11-like isoform X4 [Coffea eugenioides]